MPSSRGFWQALGPGVLFAAAAVGVSHLVQSTRAGATFGLGLVFVVLLANLTKYPAFRFGPQYAAATGTSLLEGYRRLGRWALVLYAVVTVATMFTVQAAVTVVTAGLAIALLGISVSPVVVSAVLLAACGALLAVGHYQWLDRIVKVLVAVLTVFTVIATALTIPNLVAAAPPLWIPASQWDLATLGFVAALAGWMPSALDVAVWQSAWTLARARTSGHEPTVRESMIDFHVGYIGTVVLALCFLTLGAGVMYGTGTEFAAGAGGFAAQVIELYAQTLGAWARPLIGAAAFAVMFSTTLTVLDGFPRALAMLVARWHGPETPGHDELGTPIGQRRYLGFIAVIAVGAVVVLQVLLTSLKTFVDIATVLSFLTAPVLAWMNHRVMTTDDAIAEADRPKPWLRALSAACVVALGAFAIGFIVLRVVTG